MSKPEQPKKIGLMIGHGSGMILATILKNFLITVSRHRNISLEFEQCPHIFCTSAHIKGWEQEKVAQRVMEDVTIAQNFLDTFSKSNGTAIFRTAFNAESLYQLRQKEKAIKDISIDIGEENTVLLIRDLAEGHYANNTITMTKHIIQGSFHFTKTRFQNIATYAKERAEQLFPQGYNLQFSYKTDLYGNTFKQWFADIMQDRHLKEGCKAHINQPDTAITALDTFIKNPHNKKPFVLVASNEFGDVAIEHIILSLGYANKNTMYSANYYTTSGVTEYQTVHGSADDTSDDSINPEATLRAAAAMLEEQLEVMNAKKSMETIIKHIEKENYTTPDMGGTYTTQEVVNYVTKKFLTQLDAN